MALALLLTTGLAVAGFLITSIQGFVLTSHVAAASPAVRALVGQHVRWAIPTVLLSLFSQSMVIFYFIGTGRLVKDEVGAYPEDERGRVLSALGDLKRRTSPAATLALLSAIGVFVLGGAAHTRALAPWTHLAASAVALATHIWAFFAEFAAFSDNHDLMDNPRAYALRSRSGSSS
jgi:hypothetical protein